MSEQPKESWLLYDRDGEEVTILGNFTNESQYQEACLNLIKEWNKSPYLTGHYELIDNIIYFLPNKPEGNTIKNFTDYGYKIIPFNQVFKHGVDL